MRTKGKRFFAAFLLALLLATQIVVPAAGGVMTPTHTIAEARQLPNGTTGVVVQGIVSAPLYIFRPDEIWVQDATAGIDVYGSIPDGFQLGDVVEITGTIGEYNGKKEIMPQDVSDVVLVDRGVPPAPFFTTTGSISETTEGWLLAITGTVSDYSGGTDNSFFLDDGTGPAYIYRDSDTGIDLTWISNGDLLTLVGVSSQYDSNPPPDSGYQVLPRYQVDIVKGIAEPIALARQHGAGATVTVQGAVTCLPGTFESPADNREMYVQDGTGGIDVFNYGGLPIPSGTLALGDIVTVTGDIDFYHGKMEIIPTAVVTQGLTGPVVPKIQFAGNVSETTEGLLVVITGTLSDKRPSGVHTKFDLTDATGTVVGFVDVDTGIDLSAYNDGDGVRVIGLSQEYDGEYQIALRVQSDIAHVSGDFDPPGITTTMPISNAVDANPYFPVKAVFDEEMNGSTINETTFYLENASGLVDAMVYYDASRWTAVLIPNSPLTAGVVYTATVAGTVEDLVGNPMGADYTWLFSTAAVALEAYHGSIHNHTSYSDGTADPNTAFTMGRQRGLDFMAITDHANAINDIEWQDTLAQAISHTVGGTFVAMRGFEYTHGSEGHINVYDTVDRASRIDYPTLAQFYDWLSGHPEAEGMFNHPGWMNFNDWGYRADVEPMMQMIEVGNGAYSYYVWTEEEYVKALDYGWRSGPSNNGDTHTDEWGIDNPGRTGIWASELTYDGVLEAMDAMRMFATEDGNLELYLMGDGAWMGQTIPNDGNISFEIYVYDPDGENLVSLALYTDQGQMVTSTIPTANPYTWTFDLGIGEGVYYFYARAEQMDGDRTVSAPIWTEGDVDVAPTRLEITPAQLSTQAPANFRARVTNRGVAEASGVTVTFRVEDAAVGTEVITVPAGGDAFASVNWTPSITGVVDISAEITGVPAGDNLDDNTITEQRNIVDYPVPLIVIDNGHDNNVFVSGSANDFKDDLVAHGYNWIEDTDGITTTDLASAVLLIISDPGARGDDLYSEAEEQSIADFVNNGGALLFAGDSDYHDNGNPDEINAILEKITGARIRMNSDGTYDDTNNGGVGPWHVLWHVFPNTLTTGIAVNTEIVVGFSGCSIHGVDEFGIRIPLTTGDGITLTVVGDDDTYQNDGDGLADHFVYPTGTVIPMAAVQALTTGGRIAIWGDSSEAFSDAYTYVPGDGYQNEIYNMESIYWLLGRPLEKWAIAEARYDAELNDSPDHIQELVWIEGQVTAKYGNFYDVMYIQDDTGGVTLYAPVAGLPDDLGQDSALGKWVRIVGRVDIYQGDTEVMIAWDPEQAQVISDGVVPDPLVFNTHDAALEENEGWLIQTAGRVVQVIDDYNFIVNDASGPCRVFIDGYNGSFAGLVEQGDFAQVIGLASEDGFGQRIRVRRLEDVLALSVANDSPTELGSITTLSATITPTAGVTYTWAFGDGDYGSGAVVTHTYPAVGLYTATVTASNSVAVLTGTTLVIIDVPIAGLSAFNDGPTELGSVTTLSATVTAGSNVTYAWAFGDGDYGSGAVVTHTFSLAQTYTATVTATNSLGWEVATTIVQITPHRFLVYLPLVAKNDAP